MINKGSYYEATIPKQPDATRVTASVYAIDYEEFTQEQTFEYTVGQTFQFPSFILEAGIILFIMFVLILALANSRK